MVAIDASQQRVERRSFQPGNARWADVEDDSEERVPTNAFSLECSRVSTSTSPMTFEEKLEDKDGPTSQAPDFLSDITYPLPSAVSSAVNMMLSSEVQRRGFDPSKKWSSATTVCASLASERTVFSDTDDIADKVSVGTTASCTQGNSSDSEFIDGVSSCDGSSPKNAVVLACSPISSEVGERLNQEWLDWTSPIAADLELCADPTPDFIPSEQQKVEHANGLCRPCRSCRWLFLDRGCSRGNNCTYCHLQHSLEQVEIKKRPCKGKRQRLSRQLGRPVDKIHSDPSCVHKNGIEVALLSSGGLGKESQASLSQVHQPWNHWTGPRVEQYTSRVRRSWLNRPISVS